MGFYPKKEELKHIIMPELPDVESFKRYFERTSLNKKIVEVEGETKSLVKKSTFKDFRKTLVGKCFTGAERRGKFLIIKIENSSKNVVMHFGMTGSFSYAKQGSLRAGRDDFTRIAFKFDNGYELRWLNQRKLGKVYLVDDPEEIDLVEEMGPEPLSLAKADFLELLGEHKRKNVKSFLLDQRNIAGIGNIYSDEILFQAKIDPHKKIKNLKEKEKVEFYKKVQHVLNKASNLAHPGADFPSSWLLPHRGTDNQCPRYKTHELNKETIAGRSAYFCPKCQK